MTFALHCHAHHGHGSRNFEPRPCRPRVSFLRVSSHLTLCHPLARPLHQFSCFVLVCQHVVFASSQSKFTPESTSQELACLWQSRIPVKRALAHSFHCSRVIFSSLPCFVQYVCTQRAATPLTVSQGGALCVSPSGRNFRNGGNGRKNRPPVSQMAWEHRVLTPPPE